MNAALQCDRVSARFGARAVLHDITLALPAGRWTSIVGPNGAGKSTLLKVLAGLLPHGGEVALLDHPLDTWRAKERARQLSWLGQNEHGAEDLTAYDVVMLGRLPHQPWLGAPSAADHAAVERALRATQAWDWRERALGQLSGGERQRVLLARALAVEAQVLLMDEPLANLDPPHQVDWLLLVRELVKSGKTVVSVLHELSMALRADDMVVMKQGRVLHHGACDDAATRRALEQVFDERLVVCRVADQWVALPRAGASNQERGEDMRTEQFTPTTARAAGTVWFVGAGPGDPELITVKGRALIERAGAILFAGSLVNEAATRWAPGGCAIADSKDMTLEQMAAWLIEQAARCETVVRLQTGDPALYGALIELVQPLDAANVPVRVVPGVSSAMASAAAAVESFTLPEVTQSVIFTRVEGRTPMPEGESLAALARHRCTLCIFLSITLLGRVTAELRAAGWAEDAPILVVHKASWPGEEKIIRGTLADIQARCREAGVVSQSMIIASPTLGARQWPELKRSKLYDAGFTHRFRKGVKTAQ